MGKSLMALFVTVMPTSAFAQVCTIAGSGTINWASASCQEPGVSASTSGVDIVVPLGVTLNFPTNPGHTGSLIIYGTVTNNKANALWNGSVTVKSGGSFVLNDKLDIGSSAGCGYTLQIENGGVMTLNGSGGSDLLSICGVKIAQSGGSCTSCPTSPPTCPRNGKPYCEPSGGFTGPSGYDENGYNSTLPVELIYFRGMAQGMEVALEWATAQEADFNYFSVEKSLNGLEFEEIGQVESTGGINTNTVYRFVNAAEASGRHYYRLKSVDLDGSFQYSRTIAVQVGRPDSRSMVYPNPVKNGILKLDISDVTSVSGTAHFSMVDQFGVECVQTELTEGRHEIVLPDKVIPGVYYCRITGAGLPSLTKIIVLDSTARQ